MSIFTPLVNPVANQLAGALATEFGLDETTVAAFLKTALSDVFGAKGGAAKVTASEKKASKSPRPEGVPPRTTSLLQFKEAERERIAEEVSDDIPDAKDAEKTKEINRRLKEEWDGLSAEEKKSWAEKAAEVNVANGHVSKAAEKRASK